AALARREGLSPQDAIDCVQEALCQLLTLAQRGAVPVVFEQWGPYLAGMVRNGARNRRRRHAVARPHQDFESLSLSGDAVPTDEMVAQAEQHIRLRACVADLCDVQRAVVT